MAGEISFDPAYAQNPLVNAMCVGLATKDKLATASAGRAGNVLLLVGAGTGRDGIHGASGLASRTFEEEQERRPTVQVANPFLEKVLIEACLEALATGAVQGVQDLGAAGLTSAAVESASRAGHGVQLDISQVHRREGGMDGYEVMLSESQERMLLIAPPGGVARVKRVFEKWDVPCRAIGTVIPQPDARVLDGSRLIAQLSVRGLVNAPRYRLKGMPDAEHRQRWRLSPEDVPIPAQGPGDTLLTLLASPNIASKEGVYRQYDHQVQTNTVVGPGGDAAILRIKGGERAIALSIDGNGRFCYLDPYRGGQIAVAEVCRNISCSGAEPLALTDCLNFGNPEKPEVYYQLEWCIRGMARASRVLGVPVVSGNVSLYNESRGQAVYPTPVVGGVGLLENVNRHARALFSREGLVVALLGRQGLGQRVSDLAGSEYLQAIHGLTAGRPLIHLALERRVQALCRNAIQEGVIASAHDCSEGGLAVALAECCIPRGVGFSGEPPLPRRWDAAMFGEGQSRIVVALPPERWQALAAMAADLNVPVLRLGTTTGGCRFRWGPLLDLPMDEISDAWRRGLRGD